MPKTNNTLTPELRTSLSNSVSTLTSFLDSIDCGCSYWVDFEGHSHTADIGYVSEFLDDLEKYLKDEWKDPNEGITKTKPYPYLYYGKSINGNITNGYCDNFSIKDDCIEFDERDGFIGYAPFSDIEDLKVVETATGKLWIFNKETNELEEASDMPKLYQATYLSNEGKLRTYAVESYSKTQNAIHLVINSHEDVIIHVDTIQHFEIVNVAEARKWIYVKETGEIAEVISKEVAL